MVPSIDRNERSVLAACGKAREILPDLVSTVRAFVIPLIAMLSDSPLTDRLIWRGTKTSKFIGPSDRSSRTTILRSFEVTWKRILESSDLLSLLTEPREAVTRTRLLFHVSTSVRPLAFS